MRGGLTPPKPKRKPAKKPKKKTAKRKAPAKKKPTKKTKKKPRASAKGKAALARDSEAWVREYRATLSELAVRVRKAAKDGDMSPLEMVGAMRAMAEAVNDRDGILQPLEGEP